MTVLHSVDGVLVNGVVGADGSSLGSSQSLHGLVEVVLGDSVLSSGNLSEVVHVSSVGSSLVHSVLGSEMSTNGSLVVVDSLDVVVAHVASMSGGLDVVCSGLIVVLSGVLDVTDLLFEGVVGTVEVSLGNGRSVSPVSGHAVSVHHNFVGVGLSSNPLVVMSDNAFVVSNSVGHDSNGVLEGSVPFKENFVSPGSHVLASEVGDSLVTSGSLELHVLVHPLLSGRFGHLEVCLGVEEGEVSEVAGSDTGGSSGCNSDLSEH